MTVVKKTFNIIIDFSVIVISPVYYYKLYYDNGTLPFERYPSY